MNYIWTDIRAHAEDSPSEEVCGAVIDGHVIKGRNVAANPSLDFVLDDETTEIVYDAIAIGKDVKIYHSHIEGSDDFGPSDVKMAREMEVPWLLVHTPTGKIREYDPNAVLPYEGREWHWAYQNCFSLVSDWLNREMGIEVDYFQLEHPEAWVSKGWDMFRENLQKQGFSKVVFPGSEIQLGDVVLMMLGRTQVPNHIGIIVEPSRNKILHHCQHALSRAAVYGNSYRKATAGIYRHASTSRL